MSNKGAPNWAPDADNTPKYNKYQPYNSPLDDHTIMVFGKHKGEKFANVPAKWFIWYAEAATGVKNYWLMKYIADNFDIISIEDLK